MHKFHISLTKIVYNKAQKSVQITTRYFIDDIERAIFQKDAVNLELNTKIEDESADLVLKKYILKRLKIRINNEKVSLQFLGKEYEKDIVYFYLEIDSIQSISSIEVENKILLSTFEDQQNIIKLKINNSKKTLLLKKNNPKEVLKFSEL
jgi:hypothetical protein